MTCENGQRDLRWFLPFIFGWRGLELAGTYTSAKNAFLKRVHILDFLKEISHNLKLLGFQKLNGFWGIY